VKTENVVSENSLKSQDYRAQWRILSNFRGTPNIAFKDSLLLLANKSYFKYNVINEFARSSSGVILESEENS